MYIEVWNVHIIERNLREAFKKIFNLTPKIASLAFMFLIKIGPTTCIDILNSSSAETSYNVHWSLAHLYSAKNHKIQPCKLHALPDCLTAHSGTKSYFSPSHTTFMRKKCHTLYTKAYIVKSTYVGLVQMLIFLTTPHCIFSWQQCILMNHLHKNLLYIPSRIAANNVRPLIKII